MMSQFLLYLYYLYLPKMSSLPLIITTLLEPLQFILLSLSYLPRTFLTIISHPSQNISALFHWHTFQDLWFATLWQTWGPTFAEQGSPQVSPLISAHAKGVVLDIGPGAGNWIHLFTDAKGVSKIYGVEPNIGHHAALRQKIKQAGLSGKYELVGAGAEELPYLGLGITRESVDTIVTLQVLCSVPDPEKLIRDLYGYLKPGGRWIMYEHVKTHQRGFVEWYQWGLNFVWPHCFNGCNITRGTDEMIKTVGKWEQVKVGLRENQNDWMAVPGMKGYYVK